MQISPQEEICMHALNRRTPGNRDQQLCLSGGQVLVFSREGHQEGMSRGNVKMGLVMWPLGRIDWERYLEDVQAGAWSQVNQT